MAESKISEKQSQMKKKKKIPLILMGCGHVGRQLLQHIVTSRSAYSKQGFYLRVVGICDCQCLAVPWDLLKGDLDDFLLLKAGRLKHVASSLLPLGDFDKCKVYMHPESKQKILEIASQLSKLTGLIFVDCSAGFDTLLVLKQVARMGCCLVLANKKPLTSTMEDFNELFMYRSFVRHESTVGAGLPLIATLNRIISSGNLVNRIIGSLSGTLGYVMSEIEDGKPWSHAVGAAKMLGYTESDPRDDLCGMDVARKVLILARILGKHINLDDIKIVSLYPKELGPDVMSVDDFLDRGIPLMDGHMQKRVVEAASKGKVLRHMCVIDFSEDRFSPQGCHVGLFEVSKNSALGRLKGSHNMLEIYTQCYGNQPLVIEGAGIGLDTTVADVLADIMDLQYLFP